MKPKNTAYRVLAFLLCAAGISNAAVVSWGNTAGATAWYTAANWSPSTAAAAWTTADVAQFNNTGTATTAGINMGTSALSIGAIEVTSLRARAITIGNSSGTSGNLTLNGATINSVSNVVLRNASTSALTIQNNETGTGKTMNVVLANSTNNVVLVEGTGNIVVSSNISGASRALSVNASSSGDLVLSGTNTWSGGTNITGGTSGGRLRVDAVAALPTTGTVAISTGGRLTLNIAGTYGGTSQALTFNPNQTTNPSLDILSGAAVIWQGTVAINADTRIESNGATGSLTFSGNASGSGTLIKQAAGNLVLSGTGNTLTGGTQIGNGTLTVNSGSSMGTGALSMFQTGTNNTALTLNNAAQTIGSLSSQFTATSGIQTQVITLNSTALTVNQTADGTYGTGAVSTLTSTITGSGSLNKSGSAALTLTGDNSYTGTTTISKGTLSASSIVVSGGTSNLGNASTAVVLGDASNTGTLSYTGGAATYTRGFTVNAGGGQLTNAGSGLLTVATGNISTSGVFTANGASGKDIAVTSAVTGTGGLSKTGANTLTLSGTNTYTGNTSVSAGSLFINGSLSNTSGTTVSDGATLGGNGTIANAVTVDSGGTLVVGVSDTDSSIGTLTLGSLALSGLLEIGATGALTYDKISTGALTFNGGTIALRTSGYTIAFNTSFDIANFTGTATGATFDFSGASTQSYGAWDTSAFASSGVITYVPEPGSAMLGCLGMLLVVRRRR